MSEEGNEGAVEAPVEDAQVSEEQVTEEVVENPFNPSDHRYQVKIDGEEQEWSYDDLIRNAQTNAALDKKGKELAENNRKWQSLIAAGQTNPDIILQELGIDPMTYAERKLSSELDWQQMTPEQQELAQHRQKLEEYKRQEAQREEMNKKQQMEQQREYLRNEISNEATAVLEESNLPDDPKLKARIMRDTFAYVQAHRIRAHQQGLQPSLTPAEASKKVMNDYRKDLAYFISQHSGDEIASLLGDDAGKKYNQALIAKAKAGTLPKPMKNTVGTGTSPAQKKRPVVKDASSYSNDEEWRAARLKAISDKN
jgi:hypothetical protein